MSSLSHRREPREDFAAQLLAARDSVATAMEASGIHARLDALFEIWQFAPVVERDALFAAVALIAATAMPDPLPTGGEGRVQ